MKKPFLFFTILQIFLFSIIFSNCGKDKSNIKITKGYFHEASVANQNGDFDKAIEYYKQYLISDKDESDALLQYVSLQLARIYFSKGNYDNATNYARRVTDRGLFLNAYFLKDSTIFEPTMKGLSSYEEITDIKSFGYYLKNNANTIIGNCYLKKGDFKNAIKYFEEIEPESEGYYYLALTYGLKGDKVNERNYYELNSKSGSVGLIDTKEWLDNSNQK
jgi:tetratricopeptide (TPR) repeat protein